MPIATCVQNPGPAPRALWICLVLAATLLPASPPARAQNAVATPVLMQTLDFGTFAVLPSCNNCSITISPAGVRSMTAGIVILSSKNNGRPAQFAVSCNKSNCSYTPSISGAPAITAGGVTMTLGSYVYSKNPATPPSTLSVGATLTIPNAGAALGTFTSTVFTLSTSSP